MKLNLKNNIDPIKILGGLAFLFIVLKLTKVITWDWIWVLIPLWIPFILFIYAISCVVYVNFIKH